MADEKEFGYQLGEKKVFIKARSREEANERYREWATTPRGKEVIEKYGTTEEPGTTAAGLAKSAGTGLARGVAGTVGLPGLVEQGLNWLGERGAALAGVSVDDPLSAALHTLNPITGSGVVPLGWKEGDPLPKKGTFFPTMDENLETIEGITGELYDPKTSAEKFMATGTEFATGIALPGGGGMSLVRGGKALLGSAAKKKAAKEIAKKLAKQKAKDAKQYAKVSEEAAKRLAQGTGGAVTTTGRALVEPGKDIAKRAAETIVARAGGTPASQAAIKLTAAADEAAEAARGLAAVGKDQFTSGAYLAGSQLAAGVGSEAAGQATEGTSYEPWARLAGGLVAGYAPNIAGRTISPGAIKSDAAFKNYQYLKDRDVNMSPGMQTQNKSLQSIEGMFSTVPLGKNPLEHFDKSFSKAVLRTTGMGDEAIGALNDYSRDTVLSLLAQRKREIGKVLDSSFDQIDIQLKYVPDEMRELAEKATRRIGVYRDVVMDGGTRAKDIPGVDEYYHLMGYLNGLGKLKGKQWDHLRRRLKDYASGADTQAKREFYRGLLSDIEEFVLEASVKGELNARPMVEVKPNHYVELKDALKRARHQYRNAAIIEETLTKADDAATHGFLNPRNMRTAINKRDGGAAGATSELRDLVEAARESYTPYADSGSASRVMSQGTLQQLVTQTSAGAFGAAGVGGAGAAVAGLSVAPGMILGFLAPGATARIYDIAPVRAYLTSQRGRDFIAFVNKHFDDIRTNEVGDLIATNPKTAVELRRHLALARKPADKALLQRVIDAQEVRADQAERVGKAAVAIPFDKGLKKEIAKFNRKVRARQIADTLRRGQYINQAVDTESGRATLSQPDEE